MTMPQASAGARQAVRDEPELFTPPQKPQLRKLEKAPHAFRTISEVGEELNVPQHVLRFWETRFIQLRPLKRGGGRRYYRTEDVALLRQIHTLLYSEGYTIKGAQKVLKDQGVKERPAAGDIQIETGNALNSELRANGEKGVEQVIDNEIVPEAVPMGPDETRILLNEMLTELKELRALV